MEMDRCPEGWMMKVTVTVTVATNIHWTFPEQVLWGTLLKSQGTPGHLFDCIFQRRKLKVR